MSNWTFRTVAPNEILRFNLFGQSIRRFDLRRYLLVRLRKTDEFGLLSERFCHFVSDSHRATAHFALLQEQHKGTPSNLCQGSTNRVRRTSPLLSIRAFRAIAPVPLPAAPNLVAHRSPACMNSQGFGISSHALTLLND